MINQYTYKDKKLFVIIFISLIFHLIASYFNVGFYKIDEHFSILEPVNFKLKRTAINGKDN